VISSTLHLLACSALVGAALYRITKAGAAPTAHRFLFPYIAVASAVGLVMSYLSGMELFVAYYSGTDNALLAASLRLASPHGWFFISLTIAPLLPALAILPWIGRRPLTVGLLGVLAGLPGLIVLSGAL
jgi:hypothetical protein